MKPSLNGLADLKHTRCLNNGRLPLPFGKLGSFGAVGVNTGKSFSVFVKNRNLPMFVPAPILSQPKQGGTSTLSSNNAGAKGKGQRNRSARQAIPSRVLLISFQQPVETPDQPRGQDALCVPRTVQRQTQSVLVRSQDPPFYKWKPSI